MRTFKKMLAVVISVCMLAVFFVTPAVEATESWDGHTISSGFSGGTGTEDDPYVIASGADLLYWANQANNNSQYYDGKYLILTNNIDLNDASFPGILRFQGTFDGNDHEIRGISITENKMQFGFFRLLGGAGKAATIKNLTLSGTVNIPSYDQIGGFVGYMDGGTVSFINCVNNMDVTGLKAVGGFVGTAYTAGTIQITDCVNNGDITATTTEAIHCNVAGFVGGASANITSINISHSQNTGTIANNNSGSYSAGGFIGNSNAAVTTINNCINSGTVKAGSSVGGIVARNYDAANTVTVNITNTINVGTIQTTNTSGTVSMGAILGYYAAPKGTITASNSFYRENCMDWGSCSNGQSATPYGMVQTATEFSDGTVCGLLNTGAGETVFEQGDEYPVFKMFQGTGTQSDPYRITYARDLRNLAAKTNAGTTFLGEYFVQTRDIDFNGEASDPIGSTAHYFKGNYNGNGHTVTGVAISSSQSTGIGFFGACHNNTLENLRIEGEVEATAAAVPVAGFVGVAQDATITNCHFNGTVYSVNTADGTLQWGPSNYSAASGLVGTAVQTGTIKRCSVSGLIDGYGRSGGLVGQVNGAFTLNISYSYCDAEVRGIGAYTSAAAGIAGGLVGFLSATGTINISNSFFAGTAPNARPIVSSVTAGGTFTCTNVYYLSDSAQGSYGLNRTAAQFADGTVRDSINSTAGQAQSWWVQGATHPVFAAVFKAHSLVLTGEIGVNFLIDLKELSDAEKYGAYMSFALTHSAKPKTAVYKSTEVNASGYHRFTCNVSSVQMAETITPTFHYGNGETVTGSTYSVKTYIDYVNSNTGSYTDNTVTLVNALGDYGHYAQAYLGNRNGWEAGTDYTALPEYRNSDYSAADLATRLEELNQANVASEKTVTGIASSSVTYLLNFDSTTTLSVNVTTGSPMSATVGGRPADLVTTASGYAIRIPDLVATALDVPYTISGTTGAGSFTISNLSGLSYIRAILSSGNDSNGRQSAMAAFYDYHKAAESFVEPDTGLESLTGENIG